MYKVTLLLGDGVGPEIAHATKKCIDATGVKIDWDVQECGIEVIEKEGGIPDRVMEAIKKTDTTLKAPITTPIGKGFRSVNVHLRQELGLYACVRPCKQYKGVRTFFEHVPVDLVLIRENTEDLYAGVEFKAGEEKTAKIIQTINEYAPGKKINTDPKTTGVSIKPISVEGTRNIAKYAFDYALLTGRKTITSVCKANIMKFTDGLWYDETRAVALAYKAKFEWPDLAKEAKADPELAGKVPDGSKLEYNERLIDNMCMQLVQKPELYDVVVTSNLYGDILSDLCAGLVGGLGVAPARTSAPTPPSSKPPTAAPEIQRPEQSQSGRVDPLRQDDAGALGRTPSRRQVGTRRRRSHRRGKRRDLRLKTRPQRPHGSGNPRNGRSHLQKDAVDSGWNDH